MKRGRRKPGIEKSRLQKTVIMKKWKLFGMLVMIFLFNEEIKAQSTGWEYNEGYARANIAYSQFMKLGLTDQLYAKCVKGVNYLEPGKIPAIVSIDGEEYRDDGSLHDLVKGDGIFTSKETSKYRDGELRAEPGKYYVLQTNYIIHDSTFAHVIEKKIAGELIKIICELVWISCESWPEDIRRICYEFSWPFSGYFAAKNCKVVF